MPVRTQKADGDQKEATVPTLLDNLNLKRITAALALCCAAMIQGCVVPTNDNADNPNSADEINDVDNDGSVGDELDNSNEIAEGELQLGEVVIPPDTDPIDREAAYDLALKAGVKSELLVYVDQLPHVISDNEAEMTWGFIELLSAGNGDGGETGDEGAIDNPAGNGGEGNNAGAMKGVNNTASHFRVTYLDLFDGSLVAIDDPAPENIAEFIHEIGLDGSVAYGATPDTYDSYPWGWRIPPEESGNVYMTCGYGCGGHLGLDYYATDWDPGEPGHLLESAASGWVTFSGYSGGYGYQVVVKSGDAGGGQYYGYRAAHMQSSPLVSAGQWIGKGKNIGYMGNTGCGACGSHVHYVVYKGTITGGYISGTSIPINKWPSSADSICDKKFAGYNFYGGGIPPYLYMGGIGTNGCP